MSEWFIGSPPLAYFTIGWPLVAGLVAATFTTTTPIRRLALFLFAALSCYGIYFLALSVAFQIPVCGYPDPQGGAQAMLETMKAWRQCGMEKTLVTSALLSIAGVLWLVQLFKRSAA